MWRQWLVHIRFEWALAYRLLMTGHDVMLRVCRERYICVVVVIEVGVWCTTCTCCCCFLYMVVVEGRFFTERHPALGYGVNPLLYASIVNYHLVGGKMMWIKSAKSKIMHVYEFTNSREWIFAFSRIHEFRYILIYISDLSGGWGIALRHPVDPVAYSIWSWFLVRKAQNRQDNA